MLRSTWINVVVILGFSLAACSTLPSELRAKYKPTTLEIKGNKNDVADCLMPYMDEAKFFITAEPRYCHKRIIGDKVEIFAADEGFTLYVIDVEGNGDKSIASLYSDNGNWNPARRAFENAAIECNKSLKFK